MPNIQSDVTKEQGQEHSAYDANECGTVCAVKGDGCAFTRHDVY